MAKNGNSVHIGCAFSLIEIFALLYEKYVRLNLSNVSDPNRDLVCLSKGHGVMAVYSCLSELGLLDRKHLDNYFSEGSLLKGLSDAHVPGIEVSGGSLGHGVTVAVGHAFAIKQKKQDRNVFCIVGDGEMNEGSVWESLLFAAHWKLDNFFLVVDANEFQAMGLSTEVLNCESFFAKFEAFNFEAYECDGHSREALDRAFTSALSHSTVKPKAIVARTIKGKGVSFMERVNAWHYSRLDENTYSLAMKELAE
jgi:transketolase